VSLENWDHVEKSSTFEEDFGNVDVDGESVEDWSDTNGGSSGDFYGGFSGSGSGYFSDSKEDFTDTVEDFGESVKALEEGPRSSGGFSPHLGNPTSSTTQPNPSSTLETSSADKSQLETLLGAALGTLTVFLVLLLLFILCRRTRFKRQPVLTVGSDAPDVAVVISFPPGPPSNPPPPPPSYPPPNLPCLAPLTQPQPAWLEEIQRNLRFQQEQEEKVGKQEQEKMDWSSSSEGSTSSSDSGRESPQTEAFGEQHGIELREQYQHVREYQHGQEHQHGNQHQFASGGAHRLPPERTNGTQSGSTDSEHLVGEATLGLQPGQELRVMRREKEGWVKVRRLNTNM